MAKVLLLLLLGGSFIFGFAFAQEVPEGCEDPGPRPKETTVNSWQVDSTTYQCGNNQCGGTVKQRVIEFEEQTRTFHTLEEDENRCPVWEPHVVTTSTGVTHPSITDVPLGKYQACPESANNAWFSSNPAQCSGACYPAPVVKSLSDQLLFPKNVFDDRNKPKLPLNIKWEDNVTLQLSRPESRNSNGSACEVEKYRYTIGAIDAETTDRQVVPGGNECSLSPNASYEFSVQACASSTCGKASEKLSFTTSGAIQLLSPYDPDWEGNQGGITPVPVILQWCPDPKANSYKIQGYRVDPNTQERGQQVLLIGTDKNTRQYNDSLAQSGQNVFLLGDILQPLSSLYEWEVFSCSDTNLQNCGVGSQTWRVFPGGELKPPNLTAPANNATINMQDSLLWDFVQYASRYVVRILDTSENGTGSRDIFVPWNPSLALGEVWRFLGFDISYAWTVAACGGAPESKELSGCGNWSEERVFHTTGAVPTSLTVSPLQNGRTAIPVTFEWDDKPGAASYKLEVGQHTFVTKESQFLVDYPFLAPSSTPLSWRVRTCADELGTVCGSTAEGPSFLLAQLGMPTLTAPDISQTQFPATTQFSWTRDFGSNFFTYKLNFLKPSTEEKSSLCQTPQATAEGFLEKNSTSIRLRCLGEYEFIISACVDKACDSVGPQTAQKLNIQKFAGKAGGLIPCDANNDNPATVGLDERESCQLKHLILLTRNLVDFALWKLSLIILIAMTAFTGFTMYTSFGGMEVAARVKSIWRAVGMGFLIMLFAWMFLNLFLGLAGFQVTLFGHWYELLVK